MPLLRAVRKKYVVYDEVNGDRIGEATVVKEGGKTIGYNIIHKDGERSFVTVDDVEVIDNAIILTPEWIKNTNRIVEQLRGFKLRYPEVNTPVQAKKIREVVEFQSKINETLKILQAKIDELTKAKENMLMDIAKLVGKRMLGEIDFATFSNEMERNERIYKIISKNLEKCKKLLNEIKESPFYIEEMAEKKKEESKIPVAEKKPHISIPKKPVIERKISPPSPPSPPKTKSMRSKQKEIEKEFKRIDALIDKKGVLKVPAEDLRTIDEFMFEIDRKIKRKRFKK